MNDLSTSASPAPGLMDTLARLVTETRFVDEAQAEGMDQRVRARLAELSNGFSLLELSLAYLDWAGHIAISPGKRMVLRENLFRKLVALGIYNVSSVLGIDTKPPAALTDRRLSSDHWDRWPFNVWAQGWLISKEYWQAAETLSISRSIQTPNP